MFYIFNKNQQSQNLSRTWQQAMKNREIAKNNYHATGDLKQAKDFVKMVSNFRFENTFEKLSEHVIFSTEDLAIPILPAWTL